jgi:hypothetical protein
MSGVKERSDNNNNEIIARGGEGEGRLLVDYAFVQSRRGTIVLAYNAS